MDRLTPLHQWVLYSTVLAIFSDRLAVNVGSVTLFFFYFVVLLNLGLLALRACWWLPGKLLWFLAYLAASGVFGLIVSTNSLAGFSKSFSGIAICALYYAAFLRFFQFDTQRCFEVYAKTAYYVAIFGLLYFPFEITMDGRLTSVMVEPSGFCFVCMPALFYYADEWQRNGRYAVRFLTLLLAFILTFSSGGFLGMLAGVYFFGRRFRFGKLLIPGVLAFLFLLAYRNSPMFTLRVDQTFQGYSEADVEHINASSFGLVANLFITELQFAEHPLLGGGLGSHVVAHDRFIDLVPGAAYLTEDLHELGRWDASSLMLRIISELGLVGVMYSLWFLWHYWPRGGDPEERALAAGLCCYVFLKFLRSGQYFGTEQFFFLSLYAVNGLKVRLRRQAATPVVETSPETSEPQMLPSPLSEPAESHG